MRAGEYRTIATVPEAGSQCHLAKLRGGEHCGVDFINLGKSHCAFENMTTLIEGFVATTSPGFVLIFPSDFSLGDLGGEATRSGDRLHQIPKCSQSILDAAMEAEEEDQGSVTYLNRYSADGQLV